MVSWSRTGRETAVLTGSNGSSLLVLVRPVTSLRFEPERLRLSAGERSPIRLSADGTPVPLQNAVLGCDNPGVAIVSAGFIETRSLGVAVLRATYAGREAALTIDVAPSRAGAMSISRTMTATSRQIFRLDGDSPGAVWSSSNATISRDWRVSSPEAGNGQGVRLQLRGDELFAGHGPA
jgi:hypothetical protein